MAVSVIPRSLACTRGDNQRLLPAPLARRRATRSSACHAGLPDESVSHIRIGSFFGEKNCLLAPAPLRSMLKRIAEIRWSRPGPKHHQRRCFGLTYQEVDREPSTDVSLVQGHRCATPLPVPDAPAGLAPAAEAKIAPTVREALAAMDSSTVWIVLQETADLRPAYAISD